MKELVARIEPLIPALRRYARSLLKDSDIADDLVQDCLERVISQWSRRHDDANTRQWVFAIAHNLAMDELRRRNRRAIHVALDEIDESEMVAPGDAGANLAHRDVVRALDALPDEQRCVLLLVGVEDFSYSEAAQALGIPIGTVMSRLSRGRERLQRLLEQASVAPRVVPHERTLTRLK
jgi:RNA polymerase sigma-70 factor, ECF subfamily